MLKEKFKFLITKVKEGVVEYYKDNLITLAIYGSASSLTMRPDSDLDFFICVNNLPRGRRTRLKEFQAVEKILNPVINDLKKEGIYTSLSPVIKTPEETKSGSTIFIDMTENVNILYDKNSFFKNYLRTLKEKLKKLGSKKVKIGNAWYWDLVPNYKLIKEANL